MKKFLSKIFSGIILFTLLLSQVSASAKVIVPAGNNLKINAESDIVNGDYSWVLLSNDGYILVNQNGPIFNTKFQKAGKYKLNVTVTDKKTGKTKFTQTEIIVGNPNRFWNDFDIKIDAIPKIIKNTSGENEIRFPGNSGKVNFFFGDSKGIKKIYLDKNILVDENGDGNPSNENVLEKACPKFEKCQQFNVNLEQPKTGDLKIKFTFEGFSGKKEERIFKIKFNHKEKKPEEFLLKVNSLPRLSENKKSGIKEIFVPFGINNTVIDLSESSGDFLEYKIDGKILEEKNGSVDVFTKERPKNNSENNSELIEILLKSGKKVKSDKIKIIWGLENKEKEIKAFSSTNQNFIDKEIFFGIENLNTEKYFVEWDFNGDGKIDEKNKIYTSYKFKKEGIFETKVFIKNKKGENKDKIFKQSILKTEVKKPVKNEIFSSNPEVNFEYKINGPNVKFTNQSIIDSKLLNKNFKSLWKFGNGNISKKKNPEFLYTKKGEYKVELIVTDSVGNSNTIKKTINIEDLEIKEKSLKEEINNEDNKDNENIDSEIGSTDFFEDENKLNNNGDTNGENEGEKSDKNNKNEVPSDFLGTFLLYLAILIAGILGIAGIYLMIQKIKYPDMEFGEILDEEREKILSWIEGEEYKHPEIEHVKEEIQEEVEKIEEVKKEEKTEEKNIEKKIEEKIPEKKSQVEKKTEIKPEPKKEPEKKIEKKPKNPFADFGKDRIKKQEEDKKPEIKTENKPVIKKPLDKPDTNPFADFGKDKIKKEEDTKPNPQKKFSESKKNFSDNKKIPEKKSPIKKPGTNPFADFGKDRIQKKEENKKPEVKKPTPKPETKPIIKTPEPQKPQKQNIPSPPPPPIQKPKVKKPEVNKPEPVKIEDDDDDIPDFLK